MPPRKSAEHADPATRFRRTRAAHARETAEDYAEAIAALVERQGEARVGAVARLMGVSHVTVSRIIARLASEGLVESSPRRALTLTSAGKRLAAQSHRRHAIVVGFLKSIGVTPRQAEIDAEGIEHHVSAQTIRAMERLAAKRAHAAP